MKREYALVLMEGLPFGFPIGWVAARISDGSYGLALFEIFTMGALGAVLICMNYNRWQRKR